MNHSVGGRTKKEMGQMLGFPGFVSLVFFSYFPHWTHHLEMIFKANPRFRDATDTASWREMKHVPSNPDVAPCFTGILTRLIYLQGLGFRVLGFRVYDLCV